MKDAASIPQEFNPNYEERRKEFQPANTQPTKQVKHTETSRSRKAGKQLPTRHEEQDIPAENESVPGVDR